MKASTRIKRMFTLASALAMTGLLLFALLALLGVGTGGVYAAPSPLAELHVCPSGCMYSSIQAAVDAANDGDVIKVAEGTYTDIHVRAGITQVVYISKTVTLRGGYTTSNWTTSDPAAHPTTLDAQGHGRVMVIKGFGIAPAVEGLHITGGFAPDPVDKGAGVYLEDAGGVISGNVIYSNTADYYGGGLYLVWSSTRLVNNDILSNTAIVGSGGGVELVGGTPSLEGNVIQNNETQYDGGGVYIISDGAILTGNTIIDNEAGFGGGVYVIHSSALLENNVIGGNTAASGGGLYFWNSETRLVNNVVIDNEARWRGAGICVVQGAAPHLLHTTIARNSAGSTGDGSGVCVTDDTANPGTGVDSAIFMTDTILVDHTIGITVARGSTATLNATLWHANGTDRDGPGTLHHLNDHSGDPAFAPDGYHLTSGSAAIDQGVNAGITTDIDGDARPEDAGYDLGADEFICVPLSSVMINGPTTGVPGIAYTFNADFTPTDATPPLVYTWTPAPNGGQGSATASYTWTEAGAKPLTVTVSNCGGDRTDTHTISLYRYIYLPLVLR